MITRRDLGRMTLALTGAALLPPALRPARAAASPRHGLSAFGALKYRPDFAHFDYVDPQAPKNGTFSTGIGGATFDSLNPFVLKGTPAVLVGAVVFDSLMAPADDEPSSYYGLIAETATVPEDNSFAEFVLRPEAAFADGTPVTAEDVVWSFETLMAEGHPRYRLTYAAVDRVEALDARRVRFDFKEGFALRDMPMAVAALTVLPKAWWQDRAFGESTLEPLMGSGPYAIEDVDAGRSLTFRLRDDYWARDLPVNRGRWNFERLRVEYFRDRTSAFEGFKAGAFTFHEEFWSKLWATGYDFPAIQRGDVVRDEIDDNRPAGTQGYWFNLRRPKFADRAVRRAIAEVFDFEWSNERLFYGLYQRTDSFFEGGGELEATGMPSEDELELLRPLAEHLPEGVLTEPAYVPPETDGSGRARRQLRRAQRTLDEAGWALVDGVRRKDGVALEIEFLLVGEGFERITTPYIQNLERIGVRAMSRTVDPAQYKRRMDEFDFDATVDRKAMSLTPGVELRQYFHSASAEAQGSENIAGVANPAVDALIEAIEGAETREGLVTAVNALDRTLRAMHIWCPQWSKAKHHLAYWDIYARPETKPRYARGVIDRWWVDAERRAALSDSLGD